MENILRLRSRDTAKLVFFVSCTCRKLISHSTDIPNTLEHAKIGLVSIRSCPYSVIPCLYSWDIDLHTKRLPSCETKERI